jgi:AcrR family transcriptional regulator
VKSSGRAPEGGRGYHHGDLRRHLIEVGERLLEDEGVEGFTLRECARRAGVSPSAPSHHFGNVTGLLTVIATVGFEGLADAMEAALAGSGHGPGARLRAIGGAYIRYAVAHPARFRVAFGHMPLDRDDPALHEAGERSLGILKRELRAVLDDPSGEAGDRAFDAAVAFSWSAVHGYARLLIDGQLGAVDPTLGHGDFLGDIADRAVELTARPFVAGLRPAPAPRSRRRK